jgi:hypothetical protein
MRGGRSRPAANAPLSGSAGTSKKRARTIGREQADPILKAVVVVVGAFWLFVP